MPHNIFHTGDISSSISSSPQPNNLGNGQFIDPATGSVDTFAVSPDSIQTTPSQLPSTDVVGPGGQSIPADTAPVDPSQLQAELDALEAAQGGDLSALQIASYLQAAYNIYNYVSNFNNLTPAQQAVGGTQIALAGGGIAAANSQSGTFLGATAGGFGFAGAALGMGFNIASMLTGSDKDLNQRLRDALRTRLEQGGIASRGPNGALNLTLADGTVFDIGVDGDNKLNNVGTNIDGNLDRNYFDVDFSNPVAAAVTSPADALSIVLFGNGTGSMFVGHLVNAATSGDPNDQDRALSNLLGLAVDAGVSYEDGLKILENSFIISDLNSQAIDIERDARTSKLDSFRDASGGSENTDLEDDFLKPRSFDSEGGGPTRSDFTSTGNIAAEGGNLVGDPDRLNLNDPQQAQQFQDGIDRLDSFGGGGGFQRDVISPEKQQVLLDSWRQLWFGVEEDSQVKQSEGVL